MSAARLVVGDSMIPLAKMNFLPCVRGWVAARWRARASSRPLSLVLDVDYEKPVLAERQHDGAEAPRGVSLMWHPAASTRLDDVAVPTKLGTRRSEIDINSVRVSRAQKLGSCALDEVENGRSHAVSSARSFDGKPHLVRPRHRPLQNPGSMIHKRSAIGVAESGEDGSIGAPTATSCANRKNQSYLG